MTSRPISVVDRDLRSLSSLEVIMGGPDCGRAIELLDELIESATEMKAILMDRYGTPRPPFPTPTDPEPRPTPDPWDPQ